MKLRFDIYEKDKYIGVNIWVESKNRDLFDDWNDFVSRDYLEEAQYDKIAKWCVQTFDTNNQKLRVRRMAFADFWFTSQRDLDWFILYWSGVDSDAI